MMYFILGLGFGLLAGILLSLLASRFAFQYRGRVEREIERPLKRENVQFINVGSVEEDAMEEVVRQNEEKGRDTNIDELNEE